MNKNHASVSFLVFHFVLFHLRLERCCVYFVAFVTNVYQQTVVTMSPKTSSLDQKLVLSRKNIRWKWTEHACISVQQHPVGDQVKYYMKYAIIVFPCWCQMDLNNKDI